MLTEVDVRRRRIGGAIAVLIGVVLLVLAFLAFTGRLGATGKSDGASDEAKSAGAENSQSADPSQSGEADQSADPSGSGSTGSSGSEAPDDLKSPLTVLNAGTVGGLAAAGQTEFQAGGWEVAEIGNYVSDAELEQSTVFYSSGDEELQASAEALAEQFPELAVEEAPDDLGFDGVVVVLTGDWIPGG